MSEPRIAFLDSGIGGVPYLLATRALLPDASYSYLADNAHFPYGDRDVDDLRRVATNAAQLLIDECDPHLIVVACNTASVVALDELRARFPIPFVGVVPAIKPAAALVPGGRIGVLATRRTVDDPYLTRLIRRFAPDNEVVLEAAGGLVELIEERFGSFSEDDLRAALDTPVGRLREAGVESVVLGCTHFIHVRETIQALLGPAVRVVDSVEGVARQTLRVAAEATPSRPARGDRSPGGTRLMRTNPHRAASAYEAVASAFGMPLAERDARHGAHR